MSWIYVFECSPGNDSIIVADPDPAKIPADATQKICRRGQWTLIDPFAKEDGTYPPAKEVLIEQEIQARGYYWVSP